ncbi:heme ABC exporter ATP-binding protein CcmA [Rhodopseudomonas palustris]|uniref:Heme ABC exporter ATP-binding protein CcmA n=1 Tax=Rhodopseudomonas palustris TaxID=1076 RepID=A0A418VHX7_RHOPL|nr:heme ABC exporter ATP-binding protein CcmA [Rhodopseudomonas palustris]RJF75737.1 heme ABC exporter ATP-binding protein CcmA [Rhodopseudomonas palustris]
MRLRGLGLRCIRGGREVFDGLGFEVADGEALALVGQNGAGKTSLLRLIAGLLQPAAGSITLDGGEADTPVAEQAHYLGHRDALKPSLSVTENLAFWREFLGGETTDLAATIDAVGLAHAAELPAAYLSAGQRRRLSIARLLVVRRPIWLLDEPTSALDAKGQELFVSLMQHHLAGGGLIVAATHLPLGIAAREMRIGGRV